MSNLKDLPTFVQPEFVPPPGQEGVITNKMLYLRWNFLDKMKDKRFAQPFMQPVHTVVDNAPSYYMYVKDPMDLGTVNKRMDNLYYYNVSEMMLDIEQVFCNCFLFNRFGDQVFRWGEHLRTFYERVLSQMPFGDEVLLEDTKDVDGNQPEYANIISTMKSKFRTHLKWLHHGHVPDVSAETREHFKQKWTNILHEVNKNKFCSTTEFHHHVSLTFESVQEQHKIFFDKVFLNAPEHNMVECLRKMLQDLLQELSEPIKKALSMPKLVNKLIGVLQDRALSMKETVESITADFVEMQAEEQIAKIQEIPTCLALSASTPYKPVSEVTMTEEDRLRILEKYMLLPREEKIRVIDVVREVLKNANVDSRILWFDPHEFDLDILNLIKYSVDISPKINLRQLNKSLLSELQGSLEHRLEMLNISLQMNSAFGDGRKQKVSYRRGPLATRKKIKGARGPGRPRTKDIAVKKPTTLTKDNSSDLTDSESELSDTDSDSIPSIDSTDSSVSGNYSDPDSDTDSNPDCILPRYSPRSQTSFGSYKSYPTMHTDNYAK